MVEIETPDMDFDLILVKEEDEEGDLGVEWASSPEVKEESTEDPSLQHTLFAELFDLNTAAPFDYYQTWMEEPMEVGTSDVVPMAAAPVPSNEDLIKEFEAVLSSTLTPPHSPPSQEQQQNIFSIMQELVVPNELDQLVASRVDDLTSSSGGESSGEYSPRADPDWTPGGSPEGSVEGEEVNTRRKRKAKAPLVGTEERKMRKKEQNRDAATRYRMKKKKEVEGILGEEKTLLEKNKELRVQLGDITKEVALLKSLMREVYRKKGLIK